MGGNQGSLVDLEEQQTAQEREELELLKMSVIQIQLRSYVPGVMKSGSHTIPVQVPISRKWTEVFQMDKVQVTMNPAIHMLTGRGKEVDVNSEVYDYYRLFSRNRSNYVLEIYNRPPPKPDPNAPRGRRTRAPPKPRARVAVKANGSATTTQKERTRGQQRRVAARTNTPAVGVSRLTPPVRRPRRVAAVARPEVPDEPPQPGPFQAFRVPAPPQNRNTAVARPETERYVFRDESTMAGDVRLDGEPDVKTGIVTYIQDHCSNRDMLEIQNELTDLKRQKKFQSLNRLIRFTSGFLQNAFVDDHS